MAELTEIFEIIFQIILIFFTFFGGSDNTFEEEKEVILETPQISYGINENLDNDIGVYLCPQDNCSNVFISNIKKARRSIYCALYELDDMSLVEEFNKQNRLGIEIKLVIDDRYLEEEAFLELDSSIQTHSDKKRGTRYNNYMHNKFCVFDKKTTLISSANPTENGLYKNNNNIIVVENSITFAKNFENEFNQLYSNKFGTNKISQLEYQNFTFTTPNNTVEIQTYFCPQDNCKKAILDTVEKAQNEIQFAAFAFTLDELEDLLLEKDALGVNISGVIESRMFNTKSSEAQNLSQEFLVVKDTNPNTMHHKVFVVDEEYVITGSMNPSKSGTMYNDENLLIIKDKEIALKFKEEILGLIG